MQIDPTNQTQKENYKLLIGSVLPRPIAFVTSLRPGGIVNAAPFSFFSVVATEPPMLSITCARKPEGVKKDTLYNIEKQQDFVVHVVTEAQVEKINATAIDFPPDISEAESVGYDLLPSERIGTPRIKQSPIQMECKLHQILPLGGDEASPNCDLIIGEVVMFHIDPALYRDGKINTEALQPVGRLAGLNYTTIGKTFTMPRPSYAEWKARNQN
ncbi:flavin reductase family protein [Hazenella sp. IB182353]|uniref:flavin reductase family protein n=1 Tax=Polycladospora coralii TaxID=2771432 RepID=UPI00174734E6|nr:flavin reductase family protein [Polycladospora coralii]MBS7529170.1 flavin reductase family protein [Polycladospora coralii]